VHGGGWQGGRRTNYRSWGPYLAARGYAVFAISYRFSAPGRPSYPQAVDDVRAAVEFVKTDAAVNADPARVALMGDSAGGHLAALVALGDDRPVKVLIGNYGVYDLAAQWQHDLADGPTPSAAEQFLGVPLIDDRRRYFEASPLSYVTRDRNALSVFLAYGLADYVVDPATQSEAFLHALLQAGFYVRTLVAPDEGHFWASEPIDEPTSTTARMAPRLVRFLADRL
jgi:acetyl esterase/lipase